NRQSDEGRDCTRLPRLLPSGRNQRYNNMKTALAAKNPLLFLQNRRKRDEARPLLWVWEAGAKFLFAAA
ncbi:MAG: hypothetical protein SH868_18455, partial [Bythopirellula sp.]|nr:hypothetical protein [Bythopirellula sp.]